MGKSQDVAKSQDRAKSQERADSRDTAVSSGAALQGLSLNDLEDTAGRDPVCGGQTEVGGDWGLHDTSHRCSGRAEQGKWAGRPLWEEELPPSGQEGRRASIQSDFEGEYAKIPVEEPQPSRVRVRFEGKCTKISVVTD